jgi:nicotinate-nucleotide adenylyltransferase
VTRLGLTKTRKIGFYGGSFDPIHWGHLGAAIEFGYQLGLDKVLLSPTGNPPHKTPRATPEQRFEMVRRAALEYPLLEVTRLEIDFPGPHYTAQTLERLHSLEPESQIFLLTGRDAALSLQKWFEPKTILRLATLVVADREDSKYVSLTVTEPKSGIQPYTLQALPAGTLELHWLGVNASSTIVRARIAQGAPIEYLVPKSVNQFITEHQLYRN